MSVHLKSIDEELDAWAVAKGYKSHREMAALLDNGSAYLPRDRKRQLLRELEPIAGRAADAATQAEVDGTGLPVIADFIKSLVRLIRVLLVGYTTEEFAFLQDRAAGLKKILLANKLNDAPAFRTAGDFGSSDGRESGENYGPGRVPGRRL